MSRSHKYFCVRFGVYYKGKPTILERVHSLISNYCHENACFYIDNRNIRGFCLYKDGLHLLESGKEVLAYNFIVNLNKFLLDTHTHTIHQCLYERQ